MGESRLPFHWHKSPELATDVSHLSTAGSPHDRRRGWLWRANCRELGIVSQRRLLLPASAPGSVAHNKSWSVAPSARPVLVTAGCHCVLAHQGMLLLLLNDVLHLHRKWSKRGKGGTQYNILSLLFLKPTVVLNFSVFKIRQWAIMELYSLSVKAATICQCTCKQFFSLRESILILWTRSPTENTVAGRATKVCKTTVWLQKFITWNWNRRTQPQAGGLQILRWAGASGRDIPQRSPVSRTPKQAGCSCLSGSECQRQTCPWSCGCCVHAGRSGDCGSVGQSQPPRWPGLPGEQRHKKKERGVEDGKLYTKNV